MKILDPYGQHPSLKAPLHRGEFVAGKVDPGLIPHPIKQGVQLGSRVGGRLYRFQGSGEPHQTLQISAHMFRGQYAVCHSGLDGGARHAIVLCGFWNLHHRESARCLDGQQTTAAIGPST